jgi:hypothetical protein
MQLKKQSIKFETLILPIDPQLNSFKTFDLYR